MGSSWAKFSHEIYSRELYSTSSASWFSASQGSPGQSTHLAAIFAICHLHWQNMFEFEEWHFFTGLDRISILKGFQVIFENSNKIIWRYLTVGILFNTIPKDKEGKKFDGYFILLNIYSTREGVWQLNSQCLGSPRLLHSTIGVPVDAQVSHFVSLAQVKNYPWSWDGFDIRKWQNAITISTIVPWEICMRLLLYI